MGLTFIPYEDWTLDEIRTVLRVAAQTEESRSDELRIYEEVSLWEDISPEQVVEEIQDAMR